MAEQLELLPLALALTSDRLMSRAIVIDNVQIKQCTSTVYTQDMMLTMQSDSLSIVPPLYTARQCGKLIFIRQVLSSAVNFPQINLPTTHVANSGLINLHNVINQRLLVWIYMNQVYLLAAAATADCAQLESEIQFKCVVNRFDLIWFDLNQFLAFSFQSYDDWNLISP